MKKKDKKVKENPVMVDRKNIKGIKFKEGSGETNEIKAFIILVIIIALLIGIIYGLTELFKKENNLTEDEITKGTISYDIASVGMILNRPYDEYYVLVYNSEDSKAVLYSTLLSKYMQNSESEDYIKIYYTDLDNKLNNKYYNVNDDNKSNPEAKTTKEFDFGNITLLKVKNGKITNYIEEFDTIKEMLK